MSTSRRRRWEPVFDFSSGRGIALRLLGVALLAFIVGYGLTAVIFVRGSNFPAVITVPELRNLTAEQAGRAVENLGLVLEVGDSLPNPDVAAGAVLAQTPLPGREVGAGSTVRVILSLGAQRQPVPRVATMTQEEATRVLSAAGFEVVVESVSDPSPAGRVVDLEPASGTMVSLPARVLLRISAGPPLVEVPGVVGMDVEAARVALEQAGLAVGEVEMLFTIRGEEGEVLGQDPLPGDSIPGGAAVRLRVGTQRAPGAPQGLNHR